MAESLYTQLRSLINAGTRADEATAKVLACPDDDLRDLVRPMVAQAARQIEREITRTVERKVFDAGTGVVWPQTGQTRVAAIKQLVGHTFPLPDGTHVSWSNATAEQHLARAGWQREHAGRSIADAERHEHAAKVITDAGVMCLADLVDIPLCTCPDDPSGGPADPDWDGSDAPVDAACPFHGAAA